MRGKFKKIPTIKMEGMDFPPISRGSGGEVFRFPPILRMSGGGTAPPRMGGNLEPCTDPALPAVLEPGVELEESGTQ